MQAPSPIVKHLVLVGGGHSHLSVLRKFGMRPVPGLALTLVSRDVVTPYSGSMPGYLCGDYEHSQMHIDLRPLAQFAGARLIQAEVSKIDLEQRRIELPGRPALDFDLLSLNIGSSPNADLITGAREFAIGVKPIDRFLQRFEDIRQQAVARLRAGQSYSLLIVGGGPASVELAFALRTRLHRELGAEPQPPLAGLSIGIVGAEPSLLAGHNSRVQAFAAEQLQRSGIELNLGRRVTRFEPQGLHCDDGSELEADTMVFATGASLPEWPAEIGLAISADGFIEVNEHLQSTSHPFVFAAGDAATIRGEPRPKSGVYAVRQGKVLARNLLRFATGRRLARYRPQQRALALMSLSDGRAMASRGQLFYQGRAAWKLKHWIDARFLARFSSLPDMQAKLALTPGLVDADTETRLRNHALRCAGCGAKVSSTILEQVLAELPAELTHSEAILNRGTEDASALKLDDGRVLIQSIDFLKAFVNDPWLFARIATNHCLSDIHAMGVRPHSALAVLGLPHADKQHARAMLGEVMSGCSEALLAADCKLLGGHSAESAELTFGLTVNGFAEPGELLRKSGLRPGDALVLSKALGTGILLAADMRYRASHVWMQAALQQMLLSNLDAATILKSHGAGACTDITGFGLAGHLLEMLASDNTVVELGLSEIPALDGSLDCLQADIISSLHHDNALSSDSITASASQRLSPRYQLLFDPQTAGGLLAGIPAQHAQDCVQALRKAGYSQAAVIGQVVETDQGVPEIRVRNKLTD